LSQFPRCKDRNCNQDHALTGFVHVRSLAVSCFVRYTPESTYSALAYRKQKSCASLPHRIYKDSVSDIIPNDAAHAQEWRRRYQAAIKELDPAKSLQRIAEARSTIVDQIEDSFSKPSDPEQVALCNALEMLTTLRTIAEREISEQRTGT
jgi:predicted metal-dependent hydrolase